MAIFLVYNWGTSVCQLRENDESVNGKFEISSKCGGMNCGMVEVVKHSLQVILSSGESGDSKKDVQELH